MSVFQLYKKRDFSAYIGDTMQYLKQFGKNFLKNYLVINGALMLVWSLVYYFMFRSSMQNMLNMQKPSANPFSMYTNDMGSFFSMGAIFFVVMIVFSIFTIAYPMAHMKLIKETDRDTFTPSEIFIEMKGYAARIFLFGLISMFTLLPLAMIIFALGVVLCFILVGIPLLLLSIPTIMAWYMQALYVYMEEEVGFFGAVGEGRRIVFSNYWSIIGSTVALLFAVSILGSTITMIPSMMSIATLISSGGAPSPVNLSPTMTAIYILGTIVSYVLYNILYVHQGIIYYSSQEATEHYDAYSEIDNIGKNEEE